MNVCIISLYFSPIYPGYGTRFPQVLAEALARDVHRIKVITNFPQDPRGKIPRTYRGKIVTRESYSAKIEVIRLRPPPLSHMGFVRRLLVYTSFMWLSLIGLLFTRDFHVVLGMGPYPPFLIIPGLFYKRVGKMCYILTLGDLWPDVLFDLNIIKSKSLGKLAEYICKISFATANRILVITQSIKEGIERRGVDARKVFVIPLAVDTELFKPQKKDCVLLPNVKEKFVVMYSGIFGPAYDFDTLLKAAKLLEHYKNILIVIRGGGERKKEILGKISKMELENIMVLGVVSDMKEVIKFLNLADVFVVPMMPVNVSSSAHPSKVFEFLACEKPVICCAEGELAELIHESCAGIATKPGNPESLANAILELYKNVDKRIKFGENGRKFVLKNYSYGTIVNELNKLLEALTSVSPD